MVIWIGSGERRAFVVPRPDTNPYQYQEGSHHTVGGPGTRKDGDNMSSFLFGPGLDWKEKTK
jgi:hypothetical protein